MGGSLARNQGRQHGDQTHVIRPHATKSRAHDFAAEAVVVQRVGRQPRHKVHCGARHEPRIQPDFAPVCVRLRLGNVQQLVKVRAGVAELHGPRTLVFTVWMRHGEMILCVGDSLTAGYCDFGKRFHPYALRLRQRLLDAGLIAGAEAVVVAAKSGDRVHRKHGAILARTRKALNQPPSSSPSPSPSPPETPGADAALDAQALGRHAATRAFDVVVVLAGTNDIGYGDAPPFVLQNLQRLWGEALKAGARVVALTLPDAWTKFSGDPSLAVRALNALILSQSDDSVTVVDLNRALLALSQSPGRSRHDIWAHDNLHLTDAGYDAIGDLASSMLGRRRRRDNQDHAGVDCARPVVDAAQLLGRRVLLRHKAEPLLCHPPQAESTAASSSSIRCWLPNASATSWFADDTTMSLRFLTTVYASVRVRSVH
ncbi:hypothetical protein HK100_009246, partial [Physocladia obscura]